MPPVLMEKSFSYPTCLKDMSAIINLKKARNVTCGCTDKFNLRELSCTDLLPCFITIITCTKSMDYMDQTHYHK